MIVAYTINSNLIQKPGNSLILIKILGKVMVVTVGIDWDGHKQYMRQKIYGFLRNFLAFSK